MTFELPAAETHAPLPPVRDLRDVADDAAVVATFGSAKQIERLAALPSLRHLWISGLPEKRVQLLSSLSGLSSLVVHGFRGPSLQPLSGLPQLERLVICGSSRPHSLDGIESLPKLRELLLVLVSGIHDLDPLSAVTGLTTLCVEGGFSKPLRLPSLQPLAPLRSLGRLRLASIRIADRSLQPLHNLAALRDLFIADVFPPDEFRALAAALPDARGEWLDSHRARSDPSLATRRVPA